MEETEGPSIDPSEGPMTHACEDHWTWNKLDASHEVSKKQKFEATMKLNQFNFSTKDTTPWPRQQSGPVSPKLEQRDRGSKGVSCPQQWSPLLGGATVAPNFRHQHDGGHRHGQRQTARRQVHQPAW
jgi:hypothetical protein